jgi:hypothetical protein
MGSSCPPGYSLSNAECALTVNIVLTVSVPEGGLKQGVPASLLLQLSAHPVVPIVVTCEVLPSSTSDLRLLRTGAVLASTHSHPVPVLVPSDGRVRGELAASVRCTAVPETAPPGGAVILSHGVVDVTFAVEDEDVPLLTLRALSEDAVPLVQERRLGDSSGDVLVTVTALPALASGVLVLVATNDSTLTATYDGGSLISLTAVAPSASVVLSAVPNGYSAGDRRAVLVTVTVFSAGPGDELFLTTQPQVLEVVVGEDDVPGVTVTAPLAVAEGKAAGVRVVCDTVPAPGAAVLLHATCAAMPDTPTDGDGDAPAVAVVAAPGVLCTAVPAAFACGDEETFVTVTVPSDGVVNAGTHWALTVAVDSAGTTDPLYAGVAAVAPFAVVNADPALVWFALDAAPVQSIVLSEAQEGATVVHVLLAFPASEPVTVRLSATSTDVTLSTVVVVLGPDNCCSPDASNEVWAP